MSKRDSIIKNIALFLGGIALIFFGSFIFGKGIPGLIDEGIFRQNSMLLAVGFAAMGYVFSFFRAKEGGLVMAFAGVLIGLNLFYQVSPEKAMTALLFSVVILVPGVILWWVGRREE